MKYKEYIISKGSKELGIIINDIKNNLLTPSEYEKFVEFIGGQTIGCLGSEGYVYTEDFVRFIRGRKLID